MPRVRAAASINVPGLSFYATLLWSTGRGLLSLRIIRWVQEWVLYLPIYRTYCWLSIDTIALKCLVFEKNEFCARVLGDRQRDE